MEVLFPAILGLLIIGAVVTLLVLGMTRGRRTGASRDGIAGDDAPLGDTKEHAGRQGDDGSTLPSSGPEERSSGAREDAGERRDAPRPATESERLANREP